MSDDELANIDPRSLGPAERHDRMLEINRRARQRARQGAKQDQKRWWMRVLMIAATLAAVAAVLVIYTWP
jgi:hypothetical protein